VHALWTRGKRKIGGGEGRNLLQGKPEGRGGGGAEVLVHGKHWGKRSTDVGSSGLRLRTVSRWFIYVGKALKGASAKFRAGGRGVSGKQHSRINERRRDGVGALEGSIQSGEGCQIYNIKRNVG